MCGQIVSTHLVYGADRTMPTECRVSGCLSVCGRVCSRVAVVCMCIVCACGVRSESPYSSANLWWSNSYICMKQETHKHTVCASQYSLFFSPISTPHIRVIAAPYSAPRARWHTKERDNEQLAQQRQQENIVLLGWCFYVCASHGLTQRSIHVRTFGCRRSARLSTISTKRNKKYNCCVKCLCEII